MYVALAMAVAMLATQLAACQATNEPIVENRIKSIETSTQSVGSVFVTNYEPVITDDVVWGDLNSDERESLARNATFAAIDRAKAESVTNYNVVGRYANDYQPLFIYSGGDYVSVYANNSSYQVPLATS
jgi:hypothetical protein